MMGAIEGVVLAQPQKVKQETHKYFIWSERQVKNLENLCRLRIQFDRMLVRSSSAIRYIEAAVTIPALEFVWLMLGTLAWVSTLAIVTILVTYPFSFEYLVLLTLMLPVHLYMGRAIYRIVLQMRLYRRLHEAVQQWNKVADSYNQSWGAHLVRQARIDPLEVEKKARHLSEECIFMVTLTNKVRVCDVPDEYIETFITEVQTLYTNI